MQRADKTRLRPWLIFWLYAVAVGHLVGGLLMTYVGDAAALADYHRNIELAFQSSGTAANLHGLQVWWFALFGATVQSYALFMGALVYLGNRYRSRVAWGAMIAGVALWGPQDIWMSMQAGVWSHVWVDGLAMVSLLVPLVWLLRQDSAPAALSQGLSAPAHNPFTELAHQRVLITGGTGFIGETLVKQLLDGGHEVTVFARNPRRAAFQFNGRARCVSSLAALTEWDAFDAVINLAGAPVAGPRWSAKRQAQLLASRVGVTDALVAWLEKARHKPTVWLQASAIGYYGVRSPDEMLTEDSAKGGGFMAELCARWEASAAAVQAAGLRQVVMRLGVVFGPGGALQPLLLPHRFGLGGRLGSGKQMMSWIHRDDLLRLFARALADSNMHGTYNAVAPEAVSQAQFAATAGRVLNRPVWLHLPAAPVRLLAGEMAQLFVDGQNVTPARLLSEGFSFRYPDLEGALRDLA